MYGPTEATIITGVLEIARGEESKFETLTSVPIGEPVANAPLLVLDKYMKLCPVNVTGQLYIAGDGLSHGYLNDPGKTQGVFVSNPYESEGIIGDRLYKTGDLVRWLPDGHVEFLGRVDFQVKIRGFRIECGEIENRLLEHTGVKEAVVITKQRENADPFLVAHTGVKEAVVITKQRENADPFLVAYIVLAPDEDFKEMETSEQVSQFREHLSQRLPDYMVPSFFVPLEEIPLNPNGKVDREALPEPEIGVSEEEYTAPASQVEVTLAGLWSGVLGLEADFFELGGNSLKAARLNAHIHRAFNIKLALTEVFTTPTIRALAKQIEGAVEDEYIALVPAEKKEYYALSPAQKRLYLLHQMVPEMVVYNMPQVTPLVGEINEEILEGRLKWWQENRFSGFMSKWSLAWSMEHGAWRVGILSVRSIYHKHRYYGWH
jgi:acyl carrier protein